MSNENQNMNGLDKDLAYSVDRQISSTLAKIFKTRSCSGLFLLERFKEGGMYLVFPVIVTVLL